MGIQFRAAMFALALASCTQAEDPKPNPTKSDSIIAINEVPFDGQH